MQRTFLKCGNCLYNLIIHNTYFVYLLSDQVRGNSKLAQISSKDHDGLKLANYAAVSVAQHGFSGMITE